MSPKDGDPKAEIVRLKAKMAAIPDRDIRAAIQERIDVLQSQVVEAEAVPEIQEPEVPPAPPTPAQAEQAERLVRQAMLEKQRGNKAAVTKLLEEAVAVAPGAPATLEALGDDFAERKRTQDALDCYKRAMALDPKNVGLEKKHANLVFRVGSAGSLDQQMRANLGDPLLLTGGDHVANLGVARILSFFVPGAGHLLLGRNAAGFTMLAVYILCWIWLFVQKEDVAGLVRMILGGRGNFGVGIFPPLFIAIITMFVAVGSLGSERKSARAVKPTRPTPPVNLPFD